MSRADRSVGASRGGRPVVLVVGDAAPPPGVERVHADSPFEAIARLGLDDSRYDAVALPDELADDENVRSAMARVREGLRFVESQHDGGHEAARMPSRPAPVSAALEYLLSGKPVIEAFLPDNGQSAEAVRYIDGSAGGIAPPSAHEHPGKAVVPVERHGHALGALIGPVEMEPALRRLADEVAPWLALEAQHVRLRQEAFTDALTGAWNRRYFDRFMPRAIEEARAHRRHLSVLLFDIDDFKRYNDLYGHAAGDEILVETIRLLRSSVRPSDRVCRLGGDEFAVIFYEPQGPRDPSSRHPADISAIARRFQQQVCNHRFPKLGSEARGVLSISGGIATFPWDGQTAEALLQHADSLAGQCKRQGKNAIRFGDLSACDRSEAP